MRFSSEEKYDILSAMKHCELYNKEALLSMHAKKKRAGIAMLAVAAAGLAACIVLCLLTTRSNYGTMLWATVGTSIVSGWIVIFLSHAVFEVAKTGERHMKMVEEGERKTVGGRFEKTNEVRYIRHGVTLRRVRLTSGERETMLVLYEPYAKKVPETFSGEAEIVNDFIVAYEVNGDD